MTSIVSAAVSPRISDLGIETAAPVRAAAPLVAVDYAGPGDLADLGDGWAALIERAAAPNVFMDPAVLQAAAQARPTQPFKTLLAWTLVQGRRQLAGVWSFAIGRPSLSILPVRMLNAPAFAHCYLATPVIDRTHLDHVLEAMLDALVSEPAAPKIVALHAMELEGPTMDALRRVLERRGSKPRLFATASRPLLASELDGAAYLSKTISSSSRKKLRQHRRRLGEQGDLRTAAVTEPPAVASALEDFLALEMSGWKGRQGTALLNDAADAAFFRGAVCGLAANGRAAIHTLSLAGKPIGMQVVARSGPAAWTWKTAYDEAFRDYSPGMLLFEDYTASFLADPDIHCVDSCAHDDTSYMAAWSERRTVGDLWFDVRRNGSLSFQTLGVLQEAYRRGRAVAKDMYLARQARFAKA